MRKILIYMLKIYRKCLSPFMIHSCRFYPSCSEYAIESLEKKGVLLGMFSALKRLAKCHPFNPGGYDPVENHQPDARGKHPLN
jgi:putative membrane protein insertion efficiency factor